MTSNCTPLSPIHPLPVLSGIFEMVSHLLSSTPSRSLRIICKLNKSYCLLYGKLLLLPFFGSNLHIKLKKESLSRFEVPSPLTRKTLLNYSTNQIYFTQTRRNKLTPLSLNLLSIKMNLSYLNELRFANQILYES